VRKLLARKGERRITKKWNAMKQETWAAIENMFSRHPVMKAEPVDYKEIDTAASTAGVQLPEDYREFVHRYGGAILGPLPIIGLRKAKAMARTESNVFAITTHFKAQGWRGVDKWLVISVDHAGNPIGLDENGKIWISDHDNGIVELIAETFEEFLKSQCLKIVM
jgi:hypothetical protein